MIKCVICFENIKKSIYYFKLQTIISFILHSPVVPTGNICSHLLPF